MIVGLIASSAYVSSGLMAEFGRLPPCMLPLGDKRLVQRQITEMQRLVDRVYVSLPDDFALSTMDRREIEARGVTIIRSDANLSIGEAISNCVNTMGTYQSRLVVLYGDTLIVGLDDLPTDGYSTHSANDLHNWADAHTFFKDSGTAGNYTVLSGMFSFSDVPLLLRALASTKGNFLKALKFYADNAQVKPLTAGQWHDFGHVQTYFQSCGLISTAREFNDVTIDARVVCKTSRDHAKINAEADWMESLPAQMRAYVPPFLGRFEVDGRSGYMTANTYLSTLSSLAVFGQLSANMWRRIFAACARFLDDARSVIAPESFNLQLNDFYRSKTDTRLELFARQGLIAIDRELTVNGEAVPSALEMSARSAAVIQSAPSPQACLIHGDFCFSNIFFDFRSDTIKVIDPRGLLPDGRSSLYGDPRYDLAKLAHSAQSNYDLIVSGRMPCSIHDRALTIDTASTETEAWRAMRKAYASSGIAERCGPPAVLDAIQVQLFLSMLPLHSDRPDRQIAFLAMAGQLFRSLEC